MVLPWTEQLKEKIFGPASHLSGTALLQHQCVHAPQTTDIFTEKSLYPNVLSSNPH